MRKELRVQVRFEPTRLSGERLHRAYELVVPVVSRSRRELLEDEVPVDIDEVDDPPQHAEEG
jgi:hypothetical protein